MEPIDPTELGRIAYGAYGDTTSNLNYRGEPMPAWDDLGDAIRLAWVNAALSVADAVGHHG